MVCSSRPVRRQQQNLSTEQYHVMVNCDELIATTEYLTVYTRCRMNPAQLELAVKVKFAL
jgi:hypothetical protein